LPLIGTGDWNDGMNRVGKNGRGESVWLGFFLVAVIDGFLPFVRERGDHGRLTRYRVARDSLAKALEETAWDGEWYRRGYFDDGTPLGSARNVECRIDLIAQAWSVISGLASDERRDAALASVERLLVDPEERLIKLLAPPFERGEPDPGYIASYPPGVRENGGQYTHGALWAVQAFAEAGHGDRAVELLRMTAPPNHTRSPDEVRRFRNEPYVASADVYSAAPHTGRGGWSWYTGSAAWMYRVALESILGLRLERGTAVRFSPCVAADWPEFRIRYSSPDGRVRYEFRIENPDGAQTGIAEVEIDGDLRPVGARSVRIDLSADGALHRVRIRMGAGQPGSEPPQSTR
jgi:cyclic beta-1,2-glucan synthetase